MNLRTIQVGLASLVVGVVMVTATVAQAGILATSGNAMSGFQGTTNLSDSFFFNDVNADIDYAAFAPGKFDDFLTEFSIGFTNPVSPTSYVYAYQIQMLTPTDPMADVFSVGLVFSEGVEGLAPSFIPVTTPGAVGNIDPTGALTILPTEYVGGANPTSALWNFKATTGPSSIEGTLDEGDFSAILFFSATNGPKYDSAQITAGLASGKSDFGDLEGTGVPVPAPEPGSLLLLSLGSFGLLALGRRKRFSV
ncbi:MAG: PEP-CTERM sorting domain-containing protein [Planctomycetes bacterium]|nr:PEP-CTERM sorting domain-containing protein [Planctomycetota bacterium]